MRRELAAGEAHFEVADQAFPYSLDNSPTMKAAAQPPAHGLTKLQHRLLYEADSDDASFSSPSSTGSADYSDLGSVSSSSTRLRQLSSASSLTPSSPLGSSVAIQRILMGVDPSASGSRPQRHSVKSIASAFEHVSRNDRRPSAQSAPSPRASTSAMGQQSSTRLARKPPAPLQRIGEQSARKTPAPLQRQEPIPWHRVQAHGDEPEFAMVASPTRQQTQIPLVPFPSYRDRDTALLEHRRGSDDSVYSNDDDNSQHTDQRFNHSMTQTADTSMSMFMPSDIDLNRTPRPQYPQLAPKSANPFRSQEQASADVSALKREAQDLLASIRALTSEIDESVTPSKDADDSFTTVEKSYAQVWGVMDAWHWSTWHMASSTT